VALAAVTLASNVNLLVKVALLRRQLAEQLKIKACFSAKLEYKEIHINFIYMFTLLS